MLLCEWGVCMYDANVNVRGHDLYVMGKEGIEGGGVPVCHLGSDLWM